eukprot:scaffold71992_cov30-Phaeocystis_antarctica.AAC.1
MVALALEADAEEVAVVGTLGRLRARLARVARVAPAGVAPARAVHALSARHALCILALGRAGQGLAAVGPRVARVAEALCAVAHPPPATLPRPVAPWAGQRGGAVVTRVTGDAGAVAVDADALGRGR